MNICVFGSINADRILRVRSLPQPGETVPALGGSESPGGKGANQAIAAARAGAYVRMFGAVGDDTAGAALLGHLRAEGVMIDGIRKLEGEPSGFALILVDEGGENSIVVAANANATVVAPKVTELDGCRVALAQLESPLNAVADFFAAASSIGAQCVLNAAPAIGAGRVLFPMADVLIVNRVELAAYLNADIAAVRLEDARALLTRSGQCVIVTLGADGVAMVDQKTITHCPAVPIPHVVDTTGAGDAFCGTLAARLAAGSDWPAILKVASAAAAECVQRHGAV